MGHGVQDFCRVRGTVGPQTAPDEPAPDEPAPDEPAPDEPAPDEPVRWSRRRPGVVSLMHFRVVPMADDDGR